MKLALLLTLALGADLDTKQAQQQQVEDLRAEVAGQMQLQAYDLLDELVYGWTTNPVFTLETPVVLADLSVPVGFSSGLQALVENHFTDLIIKNPQTRIALAHCPQCTALVVHSGAKGTIVARGVDAPETLAEAGKISGAKHALFLDFEVEGASLVLRARITSLDPDLRIVHAKTLSTSSLSPALLRSGDRLKSAQDARDEYLDILGSKGFALIPIRFGVRAYQSKSESMRQSPFLWLSAGFEASLSQARAWIASVSVGVSWMPEVQTSWLAQARIGRLLTGSVVSLTRPDLYAFIGGAVINVYGQGAIAFRNKIPTIEDLELQFKKPGDPSYTLGTIQLGLELRVRNRVGLIVFAESAPGIVGSEAIGNYIDLGPFSIQAFGVEVSFCF